MGEQGWGGGGRGALLSETLPHRDHFPQRRGRKSPTGVRGLGALIFGAQIVAPTQRVLPFAQRFQTFRPGAPPPPGAAAAVPPSRVPRSVLPVNGGDGTPGPRTGGPGPPTPSLGPVAAPGRADVGAPQEALNPPAPEPARAGSLPEPRGAGRRGHDRGGARRAGPAGPPGAPRGSRSPSPSPGGRRWVPRAGRGGRGAAAQYSPAPGLCIQGPGPSERGAHGGAGGWGAGLTSPRVAGGCGATVRRREEGRGPGGGGPWQPGRQGRMTMEGNALSESESGPRGRGGRGQALAARGRTTRQTRRGARAGGRAGGHPARPDRGEAAPNPERGGRGPDPRAAAALQPKSRPPRGAATRAQFPETQIPERTHPRGRPGPQANIHVGPGQSRLHRHAAGRDPRAQRHKHARPTSQQLHGEGREAAGRAWSHRSRRGIPDGHPRPRPKHNVPEESSRI